VKKYLLAIVPLIVFMLSACSYLSSEIEAEPALTYVVAPMVYVNDRVYILNSSVRDGRTILDDSFVFIGEIQGFNANIHRLLHGDTIDATNLQANAHEYVGARLYHSGNDLVVVFGEFYIPMQYITITNLN